MEPPGHIFFSRDSFMTHSKQPPDSPLGPDQLVENHCSDVCSSCLINQDVIAHYLLNYLCTYLIKVCLLWDRICSVIVYSIWSFYLKFRVEYFSEICPFNENMLKIHLVIWLSSFISTVLWNSVTKWIFVSRTFKNNSSLIIRLGFISDLIISIPVVESTDIRQEKIDFCKCCKAYWPLLNIRTEQTWLHKLKHLVVQESSLCLCW